MRDALCGSSNFRPVPESVQNHPEIIPTAVCCSCCRGSAGEEFKAAVLGLKRPSPICCGRSLRSTTLLRPQLEASAHSRAQFIVSYRNIPPETKHMQNPPHMAALAERAPLQQCREALSSEGHNWKLPTWWLVVSASLEDLVAESVESIGTLYPKSLYTRTGHRAPGASDNTPRGFPPLLKAEACLSTLTTTLHRTETVPMKGIPWFVSAAEG